VQAILPAVQPWPPAAPDGHDGGSGALLPMETMSSWGRASGRRRELLKYLILGISWCDVDGLLDSLGLICYGSMRWYQVVVDLCCKLDKIGILLSCRSTCTRDVSHARGYS
jgi:hypothetical protein